MNVEGDWYINGALRINLAEVIAVRVTDEVDRQLIWIWLRGVAEPLQCQAGPAGIADFLGSFDNWRKGL